MAKDAKGHGSNSRGAVMARLAAARTNPNHPLGALTRAVSGSGGPFITEKKAADELAQGNPKAAVAPVHPGASGRSGTPKSDAFYKNLAAKQSKMHPAAKFKGYSTD